MCEGRFVFLSFYPTHKRMRMYHPWRVVNIQCKPCTKARTPGWGGRYHANAELEDTSSAERLALST